MKIVHVSPFYYPVIGGLEHTVKRIAEYIACEGNEVIVLTYNRLMYKRKNLLPNQELINDVCVLRLSPSFTWSYGTYSDELPSVLKTLKPDIVHVHPWRHPHVFQVIKLKRQIRFKAILHVHAPFYKLSQLGLITWLYHRFIDTFKRGALNSYDLLIAHTEFEKEWLLRNFHVKKEKIIIVPAGVDESLVNAASRVSLKREFLLYVGRIAKSKNLHLLIKALAHLKSHYGEDLKLVLAGPDEGLILRLLLYARKKNLTVKYLGRVDEKTKVDLYASAYMLTHPAPYEVYGLTLLEAAAFWKPCIITGYGGQIYVAPPNLVSVWARSNAKDYGEAIMKLLNDHTIYKRLSLNARKWALRHAWLNILPFYKSIYESIYRG